MASPELLLEGVYRFKPNRATGGGSSYWLSELGVLIDSPACTPEHQEFLNNQVQYWIFTHRGGVGEVPMWLRHIQPQIAMQEQEVYLVNGPVHLPFQETLDLPGIKVIWTPGHSPGSSCVLYRDILFTGRHLVPDLKGRPVPVQLAKTFHWPRQLRSIEKILAFSFDQICPGAAVGLLRGQPTIEAAHQKVTQVYAEILATFRPPQIT